MNDDLIRLEHVLRERAAEVSHLQSAPSKMLARARRRIVRNALAAVVAAALVVVGASAGLAGLGVLRGPNTVLPQGRSSPPAVSTRSCVATDLRATASLQGAAGSVVGSIDITNDGARSCTVEGRPVVTIFSSPGHEVTLRVDGAPPQWKVDGAPPPHGWPIVRLRPGAAAAIRVQWTNECPQLAGPALWSVDLGSGKGSLDVFGADATAPPPCNGPAVPSTLEVGPFEPSDGA
jgi:hypothetical protein